LQFQDGVGDFPQRHFRHVAGGCAEQVYKLLRVEIRDVSEIICIQIGFRVYAAPHHYHVGYAA
jgi:hypothetical protein